jgi:hypothetical protein
MFVMWAVAGYLYREYTKEWCGFPLFTIATAPFFCVYSVYDSVVHERCFSVKSKYFVFYVFLALSS